MVGIYFSGTGNTKHCSEYILRLLDKNAPSYSIENEDATDAIRSNDEIIFAFSFLAIFQVLQCAFLIFHFFQ